MKVTIANKKLLTKPFSNLDKAKYFKNLKFKRGNFSLDTFEKIIKNGYTITYLYKDDEFDRSGNYMTNNYFGTQFICVDVDACTINPKEFIDTINYKPTFIHTSFSNLTELKDNKYCFHLIYCFDDVIEGENNFNYAFEKLTNQYREHVDNAATDCHRVIFTSNSELPNFEFYKTDIIYNSKDFVIDTTKEFDELDGFFNENCGDAKNKNASILITSNNIQDNQKTAPKENTKKIGTNSFNLEDEFWSDLNGLSRSEFLDKYLPIYPYITASVATEEQILHTENGIYFEDWRNKEYYEVPSKYRYIDGKHKVVKVKAGSRTKSLMFDCLVFLKIIPNITKEYLVTMLVNEVYRHYDNSDKELSNYKIIGIAKYGWNLKDNISINPIKKNFKILFTEDMRKMKAVGVLNKLMKDDEIGNNLDLSVSLETNIKNFKENGIKITKNRLVQFCNEYDINLDTDKEIRDKKIIQLYQENNNLSSRKLEKLCNENGINVKYSTIQRVLKKYLGDAK